MAHVRFGFVVGIGLLAAVLVSSYAHAIDLGVTGKKLLLKSKPKMVLLSKDALVVPGANGSSADPRCVVDGGSGSGASVKLEAGTTSVTLNMPCENWTTNGKGTLYKYKDEAGVPKVGKITAGLLKVVSPAGMGGFPVPNGAAATVYVQVTVGTDKYCMTFTGAGDGAKFLVKDATAGACCQANTGDFCWFLGALGDSCDATCTAHSLSCDPATVTYAGSAGTLSNCDAVLESLSGVAFNTVDGTILGEGVGCRIDALGNGNRIIMPATTCGAEDPSAARACACN